MMSPLSTVPQITPSGKSREIIGGWIGSDLHEAPARTVTGPSRRAASVLRTGWACPVEDNSIADMNVARENRFAH